MSVKNLKENISKMKKFAVFSGFLGAGKTTTQMALTKYHTDHHGKAAMISNDLGHSVDLADCRLAKLCGCNASEITDNCICFVNEQLADRLRSLYDDGCELVISDIPGFGVGALEHVYYGLTEKYPGEFLLAPFTAITEPCIVETLMNGKGSDLRYIYDAQLTEADLIVMNKCDLINDEQRKAYEEWLRKRYPLAQVISISAVTGEGLEKLSKALTEGNASMRIPDLSHLKDDLSSAMDRMSEFYMQYHASVCCNDFDGNEYLREMAEAVCKDIMALGEEIPHLKLLAWAPEGDYGKADLLGTGRPVEMTHRFEHRCTDLAVIINGTAACPTDKLEKIVTDSVKRVSDEYQLELMIFKTECMGMCD